MGFIRGSARMNLFLDNNVLIGYIFETDNWNSKSLDVMGCECKRFSSNTVCLECSDIYKKNIRIVKGEFRRLIKKLNLTKSFNLNNISSFLDNFYVQDCLIEYFRNNPQNNVKNIISNLRNLQRDMEARCHANYQHINNLVKICARDNPYVEIYQLFKKDGLEEDEFFDLEIILDAHHVGLSLSQLFLITGDYKDIVSRKDMIIANTSLEGVIGLGQFNFQ